MITAKEVDERVRRDFATVLSMIHELLQANKLRDDLIVQRRLERRPECNGCPVGFRDTGPDEARMLVALQNRVHEIMGYVSDLEYCAEARKEELSHPKPSKEKPPEGERAPESASAPARTSVDESLFALMSKYRQFEERVKKLEAERDAEPSHLSLSGRPDPDLSEHKGPSPSLPSIFRRPEPSMGPSR